jgi:muramidase (phage lysozyme)
MTKNQKAFLDMIAWAEGTSAIGQNGGYDVIVTSTPEHPVLFTDYSAHPRREMDVCDRHGNLICRSDAAGRYQLLGRYFQPYRKVLNLPDFSPASQDAIAIQQIKECHALADIEAGNIETAVRKCAHIWASFPGANYRGQEHGRDMGHMLAVFGAALEANP